MIRFAGVVANVRDLIASVDFYEAVTPLRRVPTPDWAKGIEDGLAVACVADPARPGTVLRLVERSAIPFTAGAYPVFFHLGIVKLGLRVGTIGEQLEKLAARGIPTTNLAPVRDYASVLDPDGIILSFMQHANYPGEGWFHANISVDRTADEIRFYSEGLGGYEWFTVAADAPVPAAQGPGSDTSQWDTHLIRWEEGGLNLDLARLVHPGPTGHPYSDPEGSGLMWLEFTTSNLDAASDRMQAVTAETGGAVTHRGAGRLEALDPEGNRVRLIEVKEE